MRTVRLLLSLAALALVLSAHPMGNFSVNHYAKIRIEPDGADVLFVLDLAEIPTFELLQKWGMTATSPKEELQAKAMAEAREWVKQLQITSDGKQLTPRFLGADMVMADGAGNLPVMRIVTHLKVNAVPGKLEYSDGTYPDRTAGWKEIVVIAKGGAGIKTSTAGPKDISRGLTAYPQDATLAPPQDLKATVVWVAAPVEKPVITESKPAAPAPPVAAAPESAPVAAGPTVAEPNSMGQVKRNDFLSNALKGGEIGWGLGLACVAVAFWFGALHAMEPGHGKTMVAAYLVGARGTMKHAVFLGAMVTFTHTISVFFLGLVTLFLSQYIMPDKISKVLGVISGLTIVYLGGMLLYKRSRGLQGNGHHHHHRHDEFEDDSDMAFPEHHHDHGHSHEHDHGHSHDHSHDHTHGGLTHTHDGYTHSHVPEGEVTFKSLVALGASGGLVPCPSALVLLLSAISIGRTGFGLLLLLSFSLGLALVLMAMGLLVVYAKNLLPESKSNRPNPFFQYMPVVSAAIIFVIGIVLTGNSLGVIPVMKFFG
jgi:ABC-type nickel/cobalt efflux system permease component RcnA